MNHESEKDIQNRILEFLNNCAIEAWPNQSVGIYDSRKNVYRKPRNKYHRSGIMDIIGYLPTGKFLGIEVKSAIGSPTPEQKVQINLANSNQACAFISRSVWQTYLQLLAFWPDIKTFESLARQYQKIEDNLYDKKTFKKVPKGH